MFCILVYVVYGGSAYIISVKLKERCVLVCV